MKTLITKFTLVLSLILISINSNAYIEICFSSGDCFISEGSCNPWCPNAPAAPTCQQGMAFNPNTDYLAEIDGKVWVVTEKQKFQVVSDNLAIFIGETNEKYKNANLSDQKIISSIQKEYKNFLKNDNGVVSAKRIAIIQKETRLKFPKTKNIIKN